MSRKSSWWLRPQRKGTSNRAALNEAKYFMEHSKVLQERIKELAAENAKLQASNEVIAEDHAALCEQNAKLRELVADMYKAFMHGACYRWCEFKEPCNYISDGKCQWYDRGHELGVEVEQ